MDLGGVAGYQSLEDLLGDSRVDLVDICLPTWMHKEVAVAALKAGKHVFCEKPIALSMRDAQQMVRAARTAKRQLLIGHVLPFFPEFSFVNKTIASGKYGRLLGAQFKRVIADPLWIKGYYDPNRIGGPLLDLHIHDAHFIRLLCGMPSTVRTVGRLRGKVAEYFTSQFEFRNKRMVVTATCGTLPQQGRDFNHGYEVNLQRGTLLFDFSVLRGKPVVSTPVTVLDEVGRVHRPRLGAGDPIDSFADELREVVTSIRKGKPSAILSGHLARDALVMCDQQARSLESGKIAKFPKS